VRGERCHAERAARRQGEERHVQRLARAVSASMQRAFQNHQLPCLLDPGRTGHETQRATTPPH
jgi:hypothetical protein